MVTFLKSSYLAIIVFAMTTLYVIISVSATVHNRRFTRTWKAYGRGIKGRLHSILEAAIEGGECRKDAVVMSINSKVFGSLQFLR